MRTSFILLLFFISASAVGQNAYTADINQQVWEPFIEAFNARDNQAYSAVHSKDFIRVIRDDQRIFGFEEAFKERPDSVKVRWAVWKRKIELRFTERIASDREAFEVGYYKTVSTHQETGEKRTGYGKFHVLLRKENGTWKILMDADANLDVDENVFQSGKPMDASF